MNTGDDTYLLDQGWEQERARLAGMSAQFDQVTIRHLGAVGVSSGWHCLEIGAGTGSIAGWLAATVGPAGRVLVTDIDTRFLDQVSGPPVEVVRHDVTCDPIEQDAFDLVHARAVLMHLPSPGQVVARLARALRPGGVLVLEDHLSSGPTFQAWQKIVSPPEHAAALTRVVQAVAGGFRAIGANPEFALDLPAALIAAGLRDVNAEFTARLLHGGTDESAFYTLTLRQIGPRLIGAGLLDPRDADQIGAFTQDPASRWLSLAMVTAWGWRP
jgi:SAM-dependent methyltransferase